MEEGTSRNDERLLRDTRRHLSRRARWIAAFILVVLGSLVYSRTSLWAQVTQPLSQLASVPRVGNRVIDFTLPTTTGNPISTNQYAGKVLIINFWATWCPPCRQEMPTLQKLYDAHREHGLALLGVDFGEERDTVVAYAGELGVSFPLLLDRDMAVAQRYRVQGLPTTIFVDRQGIVRDMVAGGPLSESYIEGKILPLLDQK